MYEHIEGEIEMINECLSLKATMKSNQVLMQKKEEIRDLLKKSMR